MVSLKVLVAGKFHIAGCRVASRFLCRPRAGSWRSVPWHKQLDQRSKICDCPLPFCQDPTEKLCLTSLMGAPRIHPAQEEGHAPDLAGTAASSELRAHLRKR